MKKLTAIALAFLFAAPLMAEEVDRTLDAASDGAVDVSNIAGSISVDGWNRNEVHVRGTLGRNVEELIFERDGDRITIKVKVPKRGGSGKVVNSYERDRVRAWRLRRLPQLRRS